MGVEGRCVDSDVFPEGLTTEQKAKVLEQLLKAGWSWQVKAQKGQLCVDLMVSEGTFLKGKLTEIAEELGFLKQEDTVKCGGVSMKNITIVHKDMSKCEIRGLGDESLRFGVATVFTAEEVKGLSKNYDDRDGIFLYVPCKRADFFDKDDC